MRRFQSMLALAATALGGMSVDAAANDPILEWNWHAVEAVVTDHYGAEKPNNELTCSMGPPASALKLGMVHAAMFDAYNVIENKFNEYLVSSNDVVLTGMDPTGASSHAAIAQAAHDVLLDTYDYLASRFATALTESLAKATGTPEAIEKGKLIGKYVADQIIASRANDGSCEYGSEYEYTYELGRHQPVGENELALGPQFGLGVSGMVLDDATKDSFIGPAPHPLNSPEYAFEYNQVYDIGADGVVSNTTRDYSGTAMGWFMCYDGSPNIGTPPVMMNEVARVVAAQQGNTVEDNALLFAWLNVGMADAGIVSWTSKFRYDFWRPIIAIAKPGYEDDGNPDTEHDPNWKFLGAARSNPHMGERNFSPPFPAYGSGHAAFCSVAMKVLINFYGTDDIDFSYMSREFDGVTIDDKFRQRPFLIQHFDKLSHFATQCAASRIFLGVHWRMDGDVGVLQGFKTADAMLEDTRMTRLEKPHTVPKADYHLDVTHQVQEWLDGTLQMKIYTPGMRSTEMVNMMEEYLEGEPGTPIDIDPRTLGDEPLPLLEYEQLEPQPGCTCWGTDGDSGKMSIKIEGKLRTRR